MNLFFRSAALLSFAPLLVACPSNPVRVNIQESSDPSLTCPELQREIARTEQFKIDARADDRFRFQDIVPTTGMQSIYNINKAESNAIQRIEYLQTLSRQKNCTASAPPASATPLSSPFPPQMPATYPSQPYMTYPLPPYHTDDADTTHPSQQ